MFEITFEANWTFRLTASDVNQTKPQVGRQHTILNDFTSINEIYDKIHCQTICLTDFQPVRPKQLKAADWPYFEHGNCYPLLYQ